MTSHDQSLNQFFTLLAQHEPLPVPPAQHAERDAVAEWNWAREEKRRLEAYLAQQFEVLRRQRQELEAWHCKVEQTLVAREQELNRLTRMLAHRAEELRQREYELAEEAGELEVERQKLSQG
jgi:hypothetical protein